MVETKNRADFADYLRTSTDCPLDRIPDIVRIAFDGMRGDDLVIAGLFADEHYWSWFASRPTTGPATTHITRRREAARPPAQPRAP